MSDETTSWQEMWERLRRMSAIDIQHDVPCVATLAKCALLALAEADKRSQEMRRLLRDLIRTIETDL